VGGGGLGQHLGRQQPVLGDEDLTVGPLWQRPGCCGGILAKRSVSKKFIGFLIGRCWGVWLAASRSFSFSLYLQQAFTSISALVLATISRRDRFGGLPGFSRPRARSLELSIFFFHSTHHAHPFDLPIRNTLARGFSALLQTPTTRSAFFRLRTVEIPFYRLHGGSSLREANNNQLGGRSPTYLLL